MMRWDIIIISQRILLIADCPSLVNSHVILSWISYIGNGVVLIFWLCLLEQPVWTVVSHRCILCNIVTHFILDTNIFPSLRSIKFISGSPTQFPSQNLVCSSFLQSTELQSNPPRSRICFHIGEEFYIFWLQRNFHSLSICCYFVYFYL